MFFVWLILSCISTAVIVISLLNYLCEQIVGVYPYTKWVFNYNFIKQFFILQFNLQYDSCVHIIGV